jgi:hypothetical protein
MRVSPASTSVYLVCPVCHVGELRSFGGRHARCGRCGYILGAGMLTTMEQIVALPDALGRHSCDCGHPEMRLLPDGVYHCPACGSEVLAIEVPSSSKRTRRESAAALGEVGGTELRAR